ncbi:DUF4367 domain-containing protein [Heliobacterium chlorum]|uniref:Anti-sigma-W factor RsiW n=1 Tax=Heliobacterium chlorum TaxID=2698 RepID=A0ABR7T3N9_HELCL|nr:DUF4367 domain-containing protein [Heliobacterium chlorum]MBC9784628.1 DUF4367 domain-containing protein [Heliobacterium chlorum]
MKCPDRGTWQAYVDAEVTADEKKQLQAHLTQCPPCLTVVEELSQLESWTSLRLEIYESHAKSTEVTPDGTVKWDRRVVDTKAYSTDKSLGGRRIMQHWKKWAGAVAAGVLLASSLTIAPVQQAMADFLSLFRVQKIQMIKVSPDDMEQMAKAVKTQVGEVNLQQFGKAEIVKKSEEIQVKMAEAQNKLPFSVKKPAFVPDGYHAPEQVSVLSEGEAQFSLDVEQVNNLLKGFGATTLLPENLSGKSFDIRIPAGMRAVYNDREGRRGMTVSLFSSPELTVPEGVDPHRLRSALLDFPLLPEDLRTQLAAIEDWQNTLVIPDTGENTEKVTVNGVEGVYGKTPRGFSHLLWVDQGVVYQINGFMDKETILQVAQSLH